MDTQKRAGNNRNYELVRLCVLLALSTLLILPNGMNLRDQRLITFEILVLIWLSFDVFRINKPLGLFFGFVAVSIPFHQAIDSNVMFAIMAYAVYYLWVVKQRDSEWFYSIMCAGAILCTAWQVLQAYGVWIFQIPIDFTFVGILSNTNETSAFLAISLPCFFRRKWKWLIWIPLVGLYLGMSIGGIIAAYLTGTAYLIVNRKEIGWKRFVVFLIILNILLGIYIEHKSDAYKGHAGNKFETMATMQMDTRARYWTEMAPICWMKPFGWGLGQFKYVMPLIQNPMNLLPIHCEALYQNVGDKKGLEKALRAIAKNDINRLTLKRWSAIWLEAHNEYMEVWFQTGIIGLLLMIATIIWTLKMKASAIAKYGFLTSCISAIWFFSFQITPCAIITITFLGVIHAKNT